MLDCFIRSDDSPECKSFYSNLLNGRDLHLQKEGFQCCVLHILLNLRGKKEHVIYNVPQKDGFA